MACFPWSVTIPGTSVRSSLMKSGKVRPARDDCCQLVSAGSHVVHRKALAKATQFLGQPWVQSALAQLNDHGVQVP